eukprot:CAMPEP_0171104938 /NCGR_PEP_ID=MMETSP0766_2-20121228/61638_1 /TAXON_ID=439317 /ORGANISM="Gambierdiscus australes, Strain CAWD 149" /LENGTH=67 /DNA_ID=CAMNT_0011565657 /DNA_START=39 /DNA_END=242 /DNA_ORIENTATION=+
MASTVWAYWGLELKAIMRLLPVWARMIAASVVLDVPGYPSVGGNGVSWVDFANAACSLARRVKGTKP